MTFRYTISNLWILGVTFLLQVAVFQNVEVYGLGFPMVYMAAILFMPVLQPAWMVLLSGFLCGLSMDFFADTGGMHAAALTFMAFSRQFVINRLEPQAGYVQDDAPGFRRFGPQWMLTYVLILVFLHHFTFFMIEEARLGRIGWIFLKTVVSTAISSLLIFLLNLFIFRR